MDSLKSALIFLWGELIEILYPKECVICKRREKDILCDDCYEQIKQFCFGKENKYINKNFNEHLYIFDYEGKSRKLIIDYKFNDKAYLKDFFIKIILKNKKICRKIKKYDIIIPVPIHKKRQRQRGYNQSNLIAKELARNFDGLEYLPNVLIKEKHTIKQSELSRKQRKQNVKGVYNIQNSEKIKNKKVILFDDVYTTGSTVNECSKILKNNGAKQILVFTIAKD